MIRFDYNNLAPGERAEITQLVNLNYCMAALFVSKIDGDDGRGYIIEGVSIYRALENSTKNKIFVNVRNTCDHSIDVRLDGLERHEIQNDPETGNTVRALQRDGSWAEVREGA